MIIANKAENYQLYRAGAFGNRIPSYDSYQELFSNHPNELLAIRYRLPGKPYCRYSISPANLLKTIEEFVHAGADPKLFEFSPMGEQGKDTFPILQGELLQSDKYLDLYCSFHPEPMRIALAKAPRYFQGLRALSLLQQNLDASSYDNMMRLLDEYPGHVVEFSTYNKSVGNLRWNTIFWEVRYY